MDALPLSPACLLLPIAFLAMFIYHCQVTSIEGVLTCRRLIRVGMCVAAPLLTCLSLTTSLLRPDESVREAIVAAALTPLACGLGWVVGELLFIVETHAVLCRYRRTHLVVENEETGRRIRREVNRFVTLHRIMARVTGDKLPALIAAVCGEKEDTKN